MKDKVVTLPGLKVIEAWDKTGKNQDRYLLSEVDKELAEN